MHRTTRSSPCRTALRRTAALGLALVLTTGLLAACASDGGDRSSGKSGKGGKGGNSGEEITLALGVFGIIGYRQAGLYEEYERLHPEVTIRETSVERNEDYYPALLNHLAAGSGLQDIQAVEVANINEVAQLQADKFVDLGKTGTVREKDFLGWKWDQARTGDGKVIGAGTDIGPMGVCYRKDLFAKAGLPTGREKVGALWAGSWSKYVDTGAKYTRASPRGPRFMDGAAGVYNGSVSSHAQQYYDTEGRLVHRKSPAVAAAWDLAMRAVEGGMTARLRQFDTAWDQAYANGDFASVVCPSWMLGYIKEKAGPGAADVWDIAAAPRPANGGGSFLTVPESGRHKDAAVELVSWLTAPAQQAKLFAEQGSFPSSPTALRLPEVKDATHGYFGDAPIGAIFSRAARDVPTAILGPKDQVVSKSITEVGILQVEQQGKSPAEGWRAALEAIDNALDT